MGTPEEMKNFPPDHYSSNYVDRNSKPIYSGLSKKNIARLKAGKPIVDGLEVFIAIVACLVMIAVVWIFVVATSNSIAIGDHF